MSKSPNRKTQENETPSARWIAPIFDYSGYAWLSRQILPILDKMGLDLQIYSTSYQKDYLNTLNDSSNLKTRKLWHKLYVNNVNQGPCVFTHIPCIKDNSLVLIDKDGESLEKTNDFYKYSRKQLPNFDSYIGLTMFETDRLPKGWAESCNQMDEIWVPSTFNRNTFINAGVDKNKIYVIPFGLNSQSYGDRNISPMEIPGKRGFNFLSTFQWSFRKGWDVLLKAYLQAFSKSDDVSLILKTYPGEIKTPPIRERIDSFILNLGLDLSNAAKIVLLEDFVPENKIARLYAAADAFVLPTRGEGWGIPFMEAMATGLPTIGTGWGAHLDYMNDENSYLIKINGLVPVPLEQTHDDPFYTSDQLLASPSVEHTAHLMRHIFENRKESYEKGAKAQRDIQENWTLERTGEIILDRLRVHKTIQKTSYSSIKPEDKHPCVVWTSSFLRESSTAIDSRNSVIGLDKLKINVIADQIYLPDKNGISPTTEENNFIKRFENKKINLGFIHVQYCSPDCFRLFSPGASYLIGRTMCNTSRIPIEWVERCNGMNEIWVPSAFHIDIFSNCGVDGDKMINIPLSIDKKKFHQKVRPLDLPNLRKFNFLSEVDFTPLTGWDILVKAYSQEFDEREDVCLYLKVKSSLGLSEEEIGEKLNLYIRDKLGLNLDRTPDIVLLNGFDSSDAMIQLHHTVNSYVMPSRAAGFGHLMINAMAAGLPVIGTRWGGNTEFMNPDNSYLIDFNMVDVNCDGIKEAVHNTGSRWAEPSANHLRQLMREVFIEREASFQKGIIARNEIHARHDRVRVSRLITDRIRKIKQQHNV
jgi:glycosyltransferase involved in cell wall biosynthesis